MEGRTQAECKQLQREAQADDLKADELIRLGNDGSYQEYLRQRAAWKRYLGDGHNLTDSDE